MNNKLYKKRNLVALVLLGIAINVGGNQLASLLNLPIFMDAIGTILVAVLGGYIPGMMVGFATNLIASFSDADMLYFGVVNILIAIVCAYFSSKGFFEKIYKVIFVVPALVGRSGVLASFMSWIRDAINTMDENAQVGWGSYKSFAAGFVEYLLNDIVREFLDKGIAVIFVFLIVKLLPEKVFLWFKDSNNTWFADDDKTKKNRRSVKTKIIVVILLGIFLVSAVSAVISYHLFKSSTIKERVRMAEGVLAMASEVLDPDKVDDFLEQGEKAPGYDETINIMYWIRDSYPDVEFLYGYRIQEDGCHVVFDLDTEGLEADEPGTVLEFDKTFNPYKEQLLKGDEVEPIISNDKFGYLLTVYKPIYNKEGKCVCYIGTDYSMNVIREFGIRFILRLVAILAGFFTIILLAAISIVNGSIIRPINIIARMTNSFTYDTREARQQNVEKMRSLSIDTGDEIENLYRVFLKNTEENLEYEQKQQEQMDTISAVASIYVNVYEINLNIMKINEIQAKTISFKMIPGYEDMDVQAAINTAMTISSDPAYLNMMLEFVDLSTVVERMKDVDSLTQECMNRDGRWNRCRMIASSRDEEGNVNRILWLTEDIEEEVRNRERLKESMSNLEKAEMLVEDMKEQVHTLDEIAFTDALTGLGNKAAYDESIKDFDEAIKSGSAEVPEFAILMIDLNFLKKVNDNYGHECGNVYLINCAEMIKRTYGEESSFRFGGDEYVVVLSGERTKESEALTAKFNAEMHALWENPDLKPWEKVSAAVGISYYTPGTDTSVEDVFKRADQKMYENKVAMKAERKD